MTKNERYGVVGILLGGIALASIFWLLDVTAFNTVAYQNTPTNKEPVATSTTGDDIDGNDSAVSAPVWPASLDKEEYDERMLALAGYEPSFETIIATSSTGATTTTKKRINDLVYASSSNVTVEGELWPTAAPYPHGGAILPFHRIITYYGNLYSTRMGILGEFPKEEVLRRLKEEISHWEAADPDTPVMPAIEYIVSVAQADAGADGMYRNVMPDSEIDKAYQIAKEANGIFILDLQVGLSTIQKELPQFRSYLEESDVHLAIDPEFSMKTGAAPGTRIGSYNATDINFVIDYLADIVQEKQLPPKVLIVHRFTDRMVQNASAIKPRPEVQVVMVMDGWGPRGLKRGTYSRVVDSDPVQFAGLKIFYKNDLKPPSTGLLSPQQSLDLNPTPIYVQFQ